ncbi:MAG: hypothetical protein Q9165_004271 [Trypethelium subeluteriae]
MSLAKKPELKRKTPHDFSSQATSSPQQSTSRQHKFAKIRDIRQIAAQTSSKAFSNGELDLDKFVKAREYEIKALEDALLRSKKGLSARAFQGVPREMRRRTASHDAKKVPKRLRERARKEMEEDNTPTRKRKFTAKVRLRLETAKKLREIRQGATKKNESKEKQIQRPNQKGEVNDRQMKDPKVQKNKLLEPPIPQSLFRKRQIYKTWLPTHLYHTKRAHMTIPKEPLWRFALPLTPTNKSYRVTHRASGQRGAVAWDTSFISTIGLEGPEKSIQGLLKALGVGADSEGADIWASKGKRWRKGTRTWIGWLFEREGFPNRPIGPATIVWYLQPEQANDVVMGGTEQSSQRKKHKRKLLIRIHPSAFLQLWEEVLKLAKVQKPMVMVEDLRFELGSIEVTGPASTEALLATLWPSKNADDDSDKEDTPSRVWTTIGSVMSPASTPLGALLAFEIQDPRLHFPTPKFNPSPQDPNSQFRALSLLSSWPPDRTQAPPNIFLRTARLKAQRELPSQKVINRRKSLATPGSYPDPKPTDPRIPIMLLADRAPSRSQGSWTLLLPWKCVQPVWYCLLHVPLSTGGSVRFGGQREVQQVAFEGGTPWFPGDFPGTRAGWEWEERERKRRKEEWDRKPKGKRVEWTSVDLEKGRKGEVGMGWGCDWERLFHGPTKVGQNDEREREQQNPANGAGGTRALTTNENEENVEEEGQHEKTPKHPTLFQIPSSIAHSILTSNSSTQDLPVGALITIKLSFISRGVTAPCSRIYRLPTEDPSLREHWLSLLPNPKSSKTSNKKNRKAPAPLAKNTPQSAVQQRLARVLFEPMPVNPGTKEYPVVPEEKDMMGFVTSGSFNLGEGQATGIGSLLLSKLVAFPNPLGRRQDEGRKEGERVWKGSEVVKEDRLCIVREAGLGFGRLAMWDIC